MFIAPTDKFFHEIFFFFFFLPFSLVYRGGEG